MPSILLLMFKSFIPYAGRHSQQIQGLFKVVCWRLVKIPSLTYRIQAKAFATDENERNYLAIYNIFFSEDLTVGVIKRLACAYLYIGLTLSVSL
jgi:hypothetical protein